jgi:hypothetical protein
MDWKQFENAGSEPCPNITNLKSKKRHAAMTACLKL